MLFSDNVSFLLSLSNLPRKEYMADPRACSLYLKRIQKLLNCLENPEKKLKHIVHIGGTSGKGSVARFVERILREAGYSTGLTISPHLSNIRERWQINGRVIGAELFNRAVKKVRAALQTYLTTTNLEMPSYFEVTDAIGFLVFAEADVDWAVIEVGCGGRYDATNVLPQKDVAVITNIGLDHTEILGETIKKIAYEKAGILKNSLDACTAAKEYEAIKVIEKEAYRWRVPIGLIITDAYDKIEQGLSGSVFARGTIYRLRVLGEHQIENAILAEAVARRCGIQDEQVIQRGLLNARHPACMEVISKKPLIILDSAHNEDKMKTTIETVLTLFQDHLPRIHLVVGFSENKQWQTMVRQLARLKPAKVLATRFTVNQFRKVRDPRALAASFKKTCPKASVNCFLDPLEAYAAARKDLRLGDLLLITGSVFLAGEIRPIVRRERI